MIYDNIEKRFFILANNRNDCIGFFLMSFSEKTHEVRYHINWEHKLPIDDADMSLMKTYERICDDKKDVHEHDAEEDTNPLKNNRHIVVSFKTQYINTYNIFVINIETGQFEFWHESYALFEAE